MREVRTRVKRRRFSKPLLIFTALVELVIAGAYALFLVTRGPLGNIRDYLISTAMGTMNHQYIATMLFTRAQIDAVIKKDSEVVAPQQNIEDVKPVNYDSTDITLKEFRAKDGSYYAYLLEVTNPLRVKAAMTKKVGIVGECTSTMAKDHNAIAAINGGGFANLSNATGTGAMPTDFVICDGKEWIAPGYKDTQERNVVALDSKGRLIVGQHSLKELRALHVTQAMTFNRYKPLITGGKGNYNEKTSGNERQPRTAIGQKKDGSILMLVMDGRRVNMLGATVLDVQHILLDNGAVTAVMLDGGASTTLYYRGSVYNNPCSALGERSVPTCFYVTK